MSLDKAIAERSAVLKKINEGIVIATKEAEKQQKVARIALTSLKAEVAEAKVQVLAAKAQLGRVEKEIAKRKKYAEEQEIAITEASEVGNTKLHDLRDEIELLKRQKQYETEELERQKQEVVTKLYALEAQRNKLAEDITQLESSYAMREDQLLKQYNDLEANLRELKHERRTEQERLNTISLEVDAKLAILKEKETSLLAKTAALRRQQEELQLNQRRFQGVESLYQ